MSSSIALRRSPNPGALTAATLRPPRSLLTTSVARASPSTSSAMTSSGFWWDAELHRVKGLRLLACGDVADTQTAFHDALRVAREQQAKSLELRAATSLARLWGEQGQSTEARELLASVHGWFTEGFDTADLKEAKGLLDELM